MADALDGAAAFERMESRFRMMTPACNSTDCWQSQTISGSCRNNTTRSGEDCSEIFRKRFRMWLL
jgi:hypothetical protein